MNAFGQALRAEHPIPQALKRETTGHNIDPTMAERSGVLVSFVIFVFHQEHRFSENL